MGCDDFAETGREKAMISSCIARDGMISRMVGEVLTRVFERKSIASGEALGKRVLRGRFFLMGKARI